MELRRLDRDVYACEQEDRGLGWSNSGFVALGGGFVIDTLYDVTLTRRMVELYASVHPSPAARLLNTHHNGDHCWGNQLFAGAEIIAHRGCADRFADFTPAQAEAIRTMADPPDHLRDLVHEFSPFDFSDVVLTPPTTVIDGDRSYDLDGTRVDVLFVGPAHTEGDLVVHVPASGVVFAGDIFFHRCTPIGWEGSTKCWIDALARIESLAPQWVVPGHGPVCGTDGVRSMREYLEYVRDESRVHWQAGRTPLEASLRIELGPYAGWNEPFRLAANVHRCYREFAGAAWDTPYDSAAVMADLRALKAAQGPSGEPGPTGHG
jgi:glyoxylase-like metal-dependent hydrolase (beta-lactamase superfamily II)